MFYVHLYLGKIPILTNIFQSGWNHQLAVYVYHYDSTRVLVYTAQMFRLGSEAWNGMKREWILYIE